MKYVRSTLNIFNVMVILTIPAFVAGIGFAGDETITQLKAVFKSCEQVQASKNLSLPLYEEAISCAKTEIEFLRRMEGVSQTCLFSLGGFTMSHGAALINRSLEENMLQSSRRAVIASSKDAYYDISMESRGIAEDAQKEAAKNLEEAYRSCFSFKEINNDALFYYDLSSNRLTK